MDVHDFFEGATAARARMVRALTDADFDQFAYAFDDLCTAMQHPAFKSRMFAALAGTPSPTVAVALDTAMECLNEYDECRLMKSAEYEENGNTVRIDFRTEKDE